MPLSEHEQRLLEQIERALYAEDPKFASTVRGAQLHRPSRRRRLQGVALFVLGLVLLVLGVALPVQLADIPVISVLGFLVMFGGAVFTLTALGRGEPAPDDDAPAEAAKPRRGSSFAQRMEERFRRRFEDDQ
ncbi:Protein of unknown function (DUF3040) [Streptoalloteichus tenebrarius]|uniref:Transmembrane protein n=1 Tax=Streptoalloteichus tenebrarius (strain ATCC 17920 / DSM 40477 / JCM 4838 / CBS 697.72 / NBRC 16177 / NCIMB 11028 / NRRL B-12390 / A12253. 1 / ISP 5477) TaxID=1933 RepID=A0ABT1HN65_STRSD|nr:DUF3040 domain-containing protein [Streptoalloteichus tenebrarius]MCP2256951.1 Protein of unknown function (DUF3040) [Streptoalloteichus tenebrarius]BFF00137.1 DUF3040 domain-containing protein [Streptoalloteichus tenebrarius]